MSKNISSLSGRDGKELDDALWERLQQAAAGTGAPGAPELGSIADDFLVGAAVTYGASTFYDLLKPENRGVKAYVCNGSACLVAGTQEHVHHALKGHFSEDEIGHLCCLGRCHENSAFHVGGRNYSGTSIDHLDQLVAGLKAGGRVDVEAGGVHHVGCSTADPVLTAAMPPLGTFYALWEQVLRSDPADVLREIKVAEVRGRGGAGFPMGLKLEACRNAEDNTGNGTPRKYIVCNADEGDPAAFSDRYLLEQRPHLVLLGMMIAGFCVGADTGVLYIRAEYPEAVDIVREAVAELERHGWIGNDIKGSGFNYRFRVIKAAGAYVCGEETALLNSLEGKRGEVRTRPPYPAQQGLFNRPTVVNNVETLACVPWVVKHGRPVIWSAWTAASTGQACTRSSVAHPWQR